MSNGVKTQIWTKLKLWQNTKLDLWKNLNGDKTQKLELWRKKTRIVTKLKNSNCDKTQKLKLWQNLNYEEKKNWIVTKLKNLNCDKTQKLKLWQNLNYDTSQFIKSRRKNHLKGPLVRPFWNLDIWWYVLWAVFCNFCDVFFFFFLISSYLNCAKNPKVLVITKFSFLVITI